MIDWLLIVSLLIGFALGVVAGLLLRLITIDTSKHVPPRDIPRPRA